MQDTYDELLFYSSIVKKLIKAVSVTKKDKWRITSHLTRPLQEVIQGTVTIDQKYLDLFAPKEIQANNYMAYIQLLGAFDTSLTLQLMKTLKDPDKELYQELVPLEFSQCQTLTVGKHWPIPHSGYLTFHLVIT